MRTQPSHFKAQVGLALFISILFLAGLGGGTCGPPTSIPVVPGAVGFGTTTPAGRGGEVYRVWNLLDDHTSPPPGSLRACIEDVDSHGPRVCVFEISGEIVPTGKMSILIPFITIAGQTAPSPGITLKGRGLRVETHDVLVQHIRMRTGDVPFGAKDGFSAVSWDQNGSPEVFNVVADHISASWATDENWDASESIEGAGNVHDVTFLNSISSEGLYLSVGGPHSMGALIEANKERVAMIGNLFAHNSDRNPKFGHGTTSVFANNVVYDRGRQAAVYNGLASGGTPVPTTPTLASMVGNVYIEGPRPCYDAYQAPFTLEGVALGDVFHVSDTIWTNFDPSAPLHGPVVDDWDAVHNKSGLPDSFFRVATPPAPILGFTPMPASTVEAHVL